MPPRLCSSRSGKRAAGLRPGMTVPPCRRDDLGAVFDKLAAEFGTVQVIVDQPASIGALP
ncbi:hypothetical protein SANT12839_021230 [Streptomyces antimycoticus]|uniref:Uncharacterized protein n=1 Tax=Streptomyces antimycoticus TaxID=68175 RepID=A0A4D4JWR9_9ACTN|nr:hypothetical protein SANT12839_021230 [Streptomyces antimycoticus]